MAEELRVIAQLEINEWLEARMLDKAKDLEEALRESGGGMLSIIVRAEGQILKEVWDWVNSEGQDPPAFVIRNSLVGKDYDVD